MGKKHHMEDGVSQLSDFNNGSCVYVPYKLKKYDSKRFSLNGFISINRKLSDLYYVEFLVIHLIF